MITRNKSENIKGIHYIFYSLINFNIKTFCLQENDIVHLTITDYQLIVPHTIWQLVLLY